MNDNKRLTEWIEDNGVRRAHIRSDLFVPMTDVFGRLAEYEDLGTLVEIEDKLDFRKRLEEFLAEWKTMSRAREDDLK